MNNINNWKFNPVNEDLDNSQLDNTLWKYDYNKSADLKIINEYEYETENTVEVQLNSVDSIEQLHDMYNALKHTPESLINKFKFDTNEEKQAKLVEKYSKAKKEYLLNI